MRLEEIAESYGDEVELIWRSFMLRPQPEERPVEKFAAYTRSWERPASLEPTITFNAWSGDNAPPSHSLRPVFFRPEGSKAVRPDASLEVRRFEPRG